MHEWPRRKPSAEIREQVAWQQKGRVEFFLARALLACVYDNKFDRDADFWRVITRPAPDLFDSNVVILYYINIILLYK
jgi:hypothetical protein